MPPSQLACVEVLCAVAWASVCGERQGQLRGCTPAETRVAVLVYCPPPPLARTNQQASVMNGLVLHVQRGFYCNAKRAATHPQLPCGTPSGSVSN